MLHLRGELGGGCSLGLERRGQGWAVSFGLHPRSVPEAEQSPAQGIPAGQYR